MSIKQNTEKCYCISFRRAAKTVTAYYDRMLLDAGITINQYSLLVNLYRTAPCSVSTLAKTMKLDRTTLVRNIKPLVEMRLLQDLAEGGGRDRQLIVTAMGLKCLGMAQRLWEKAQAGLKNYIGGKDFETLLAVIDGLDRLEQG
jgi:DNA-binding MarR family transcriptional regulator